MSRRWRSRSFDGPRARRRSVRRELLAAAVLIAILYLVVRLEPYWQESTPIGDRSAIHVIDGDTFRYGNERIRIADIDAPEIDPPQCQREAELGLRAANRLRQILAQGRIELRRSGRDEDEHGRKLRTVTRNGRSVGDMLVAEGLARPYESGRQPWC